MPTGVPRIGYLAGAYESSRNVGHSRRPGNNAIAPRGPIGFLRRLERDQGPFTAAMQGVRQGATVQLSFQEDFSVAYASSRRLG